MSQSSPDSRMTGACSADATIMRMPTGSIVSREGSAVPPERYEENSQVYVTKVDPEDKRH